MDGRKPPQKFNQLTPEEAAIVSTRINVGLDRCFDFLKMEQGHALACGYCMGLLYQIDGILKGEVKVEGRNN